MTGSASLVAGSTQDPSGGSLMASNLARRAWPRLVQGVSVSWRCSVHEAQRLGADFDVAFVAMKAYDSLLARSLLDAVALAAADSVQERRQLRTLARLSLPQKILAHVGLPGPRDGPSLPSALSVMPAEQPALPGVTQ